MFKIPEYKYDNAADWIFPLLSTEDCKKNFFLYGDSTFKDTASTRKLINENNIAAVFLEQKNVKSYVSHVPIYPKQLPDTPDEKYLLYCLGSSNQKTAEDVNKMVSATFKMLNDVEAELTKRNFQIWVVANPAAYQAKRVPNKTKYNYNVTHSVMFDQIDKLNEKINVFDWYGSIVENTTEDFRTIQFSKYGYFDFQKLILYHVMQTISGISILRLEVLMNTFMPYIKKTLFLKLSSKAKSCEARDTDKENFKTFYGIMREAYELERNEKNLTLPYSIALSEDNTVAAIIDAKTFRRGTFGKVVIQETYKKLNLEVAIKVLDARQFDGNVEKLRKKLTGIKNDYIIVIHDIATDKENFNIFYIATEFCKKGNLLQQISKKKRTKKDLFVRWIKNIANALIYLHKNYIVHCDIKPTNIIIDRYDNAKICDVDSIQWINSEQPCQLPDNVQFTTRYAAPELLKDNELCDSRIDVWSYCLIVLELIVKILTAKFCQDLRDGKLESLNEVLTSIPKSLQDLIRAGLIVETGINTEEIKFTTEEKNENPQTVQISASVDRKMEENLNAEEGKQKSLHGDSCTKQFHLPADTNKKRIFMKDMVPLLIEIHVNLGNMSEEEWQACATEDVLEKHLLRR